ncbi:unnamed protein product [Cuscuta epithymum]|uniref:Uncharacterized protein n=1 Tax=Cuscuta epithymum TaxID=186058 RepID=A0AAV0CKT3_9ASTE|nr:unnamed protein product [Cuscuta epithymum]
MVSVGKRALLLRNKSHNLIQENLTHQEGVFFNHCKHKRNMARRDGKKHAGFSAGSSAKCLSGGKVADGNVKARKPSKHQSETSCAPFIRNPIDPETVKYFAEIANVIEGTEIDLEERSVICGNALEETRGKEAELATDYVISHTLQILLEGCSVDHLCDFLQSCAKKFSYIATDKSGSHVVETALKSMAVHLQDSEQLSFINETLRKLCEAIILNPVDVMCDCYGSHVLRSLLCLLNGIPLDQFHITKSATVLAERMNFKVPRSEYNNMSYSSQRFPDLLNYLVLEMLNSTRGNISNLAMDQYCSLVLQTALKLLVGNELELLLKVVQIILGFDMDMDGNLIGRSRLQEISEHIEEPAYSHLIEVILEVSPDTVYNELLQRVFKTSLFQMSSHHCGNFVVQALASHAKSSEHIDVIWGELGTKFKELFEMGRSGVIASLIAATQKLNHREAECCQALASAVCVGDESLKCIIPRILFLDSFFNSEDRLNWSWSSHSRIHVVGSLILQSIFRFHSELVKTFVSSITSLEEHQLLAVSKDPSGSRVIEAFLNSNVSAKLKRKLVIKLQGHFGELSVHPSGSFMIEKCFNTSNLSLRETIVSEMLPLRAELSRTKQGPFLLRRFDIDGYAKQPDLWKKRQASNQSVRQEFYAEFGTTDTKTRKDSFLADTRHKSQPEKLNEMKKDIETSLASSRTSSVPFLAHQGSKVKTKSAKKQSSGERGLDKYSVGDDYSKVKSKIQRTEKVKDGTNGSLIRESEHNVPSESSDKNEKKRVRRDEKEKKQQQGDESLKTSKKQKKKE